MSTTERPGSRRRTSIRRSRPLRSERLTSRSSKSKGRSSSRAKPDSPVPALVTPYPSLVSSSSRPSRISDSSSITRIEPLCMDCFPERGEFNVEGCAFSWGRAYIDFSCMLLDYTVADGQTQACAAAVGFGGKERIENAMNVLARDACSCVCDFDFHAAVVGGGADFKHAAGGHGVASIQKKIKKNLLELVGGAAHGRKRLAQLLDDVDLGSLERMRDEG